MSREDYFKILTDLQARHNALVEQRTDLQVQLGELDNQIAGLKKAMANLSPLAGFSMGDDITGMGMTDAIRAVLRSAKERMTANQVKDELANKGFELSNYGNPMASVYKVLSRLEDSGAVIKESEGFNVFYKWKRSLRQAVIAARALDPTPSGLPKPPSSNDTKG